MIIVLVKDGRPATKEYLLRISRNKIYGEKEQYYSKEIKKKQIIQKRCKKILEKNGKMAEML